MPLLSRERNGLIRSYSKLKWHAAKFENSSCPSKIVKRYDILLESPGEDKIGQFIIHVAGWVAFAKPSRGESLCEAAHVLHKWLKRTNKAKWPTRLRIALNLVTGRLRQQDLPEKENAVWSSLQGIIRRPSARTERVNNDDSPNVRIRLLKRPWSSWKSDGNKFFECVVNRGEKHRNVFKTFKDGDMLVFGEVGRKSVDGVAVVNEGPKTLCSDRSALKELLPFGGEAVAILDAYLDDGASFDFVAFREVFDLRALRLSWRTLCKRLQCKMLGQWCGFPRLRGRQSCSLLQEMIHLPGVIKHCWPPVRLPLTTSGMISSVICKKRVCKLNRSVLAWESRSLTEKEENIKSIEISLCRATMGEVVDTTRLRKLLYAIVGGLSHPRARTERCFATMTLIDVQVRAAAKIQSRVRQALITALQVWRVDLWLEDKQIRPVLERVQFLVQSFEHHRGSLDDAGAGREWQTLKALVGIGHVLNLGNSQNGSDERSSARSKQRVKHKSISHNKYTPNSTLCQMPHVVHRPGEGKSLRCSRCSLIVSSEWFLARPQSGKLSVLRPRNGHTTCAAPFIVVDGSPSVNDNIENIAICSHGRSFSGCARCRASKLEKMNMPMIRSCWSHLHMRDGPLVIGHLAGGEVVC